MTTKYTHYEIVGEKAILYNGEDKVDELYIIMILNEWLEKSDYHEGIE